jgi:hypothetical protein
MQDCTGSSRDLSAPQSSPSSAQSWPEYGETTTKVTSSQRNSWFTISHTSTSRWGLLTYYTRMRGQKLFPSCSWCISSLRLLDTKGRNCIGHRSTVVEVYIQLLLLLSSIHSKSLSWLGTMLIKVIPTNGVLGDFTTSFFLKLVVCIMFMDDSCSVDI